MSSDVLARLETLLSRVVARRALPRTVAAPVTAPVIATTPAPRAIAPEPVRPEARPVEARHDDAETVPMAPRALTVPSAETPVVAEAPKPVVEAPKPVAEAPKPVAEAPKPVAEAPKPVAEAPKPASLPLPGPANIVRADDRIAASFAAGGAASPGFGDDDADHVETLAFRLGRALPKLAQVPAPPLPVTSRDEPGERRSERFTPSLPSTPVAASVSEPPPKPAAPSLRALLQRSVALRPRG